MNDPKARRSHPPLEDALGKMCAEGKQLADYLWQVPKDEQVRGQVVALLERIAGEGTKQGRREMPRICEELATAAKATPSPRQVDLLVNGFDRLYRLWQSPQSGLL